MKPHNRPGPRPGRHPAPYESETHHFFRIFAKTQICPPDQAAKDLDSCIFTAFAPLFARPRQASNLPLFRDIGAAQSDHKSLIRRRFDPFDQPKREPAGEDSAAEKLRRAGPEVLPRLLPPPRGGELILSLIHN